MARQSSRNQILILITVYLLLFWSDIATYRPGMDSMTYGAVARHMVETGDWIVPHYSSQAYANFFQHPPLALWLMAISMKVAAFLFGESAAKNDLILKFLPSLFAALSASIVYIWSKRLRGRNFAFLATLVLLTSTRFVKYSKGFMLDPFLATFSLLAVYLACESRIRERGTSLLVGLSGVSVAAAFLSKGLFAFAPLAVILCLLAADLLSTKRGGGRVALFLLGAMLPIVAWFVFGDAANYLHHYYIEHVAGRIGPHPLIDHFAPLLNLWKVYWPWLPFFVFGVIVHLRENRPWASLENFFGTLRKEETAIALTALAFLGGFCLVGSFLEQYHTSFYPFAAPVVALGVFKGWEKYAPRIEKALLALLFVLTLGVFFFPASFRSHEHKHPLRKTLRAIRPSCPEPGIRRFVVSTGVAEIWYALAAGSWYTNADAYSDTAKKSPTELSAELLLANTHEEISPEWERAAIGTEPFAIYRKRGMPICLGASKPD